MAQGHPAPALRPEKHSQQCPTLCLRTHSVPFLIDHGSTMCSFFLNTYMSVTHPTTPDLPKPSCAGVYPRPRVALPHISPLLTAPSLFIAQVLSSPLSTLPGAQLMSPCALAIYRVHPMASGSPWPLECPRSPLRSASSTRTSSRRLPSLSSDCPSTTASWAEG